MKKLIIPLILAGFLITGVVLASGGNYNNYSSFFNRVGGALIPTNLTDSIGSATQRISKIWATDFDATTVTIGGVSGGDIDMNGNRLNEVGTINASTTVTDRLTVQNASTTGTMTIGDNQQLTDNSSNYLQYKSLQDFVSLFNIECPPSSSFRCSEATLALNLKATTGAHWIDHYNNNYPGGVPESVQWGIREGISGTATFTPMVIDRSSNNALTHQAILFTWMPNGSVGFFQATTTPWNTNSVNQNVAFAISSSTAPIVTAIKGGSTANLLELQNTSNAFLSGFTASGGLLMNIASTTAFNIQDGSGVQKFWVDSNTGNATTTGSLYVDTNTLAVDADDGRVGIGTANPQITLDVTGSSSTSYAAGSFSALRFSLTNTNTTNNSFSEISMGTNDTNGAFVTNARIIAVHTSHSPSATSADLAVVLRNAGTPTEVLRLGPSGKATTTDGLTVGLGGNPNTLDMTNDLFVKGDVETEGNTIGIDSSGTATLRGDRGATTDFASLILTTGGTDQWSVQMRNDSTNNIYFRDSVNGANVFKAFQGATTGFIVYSSSTIENNLRVTGSLNATSTIIDNHRAVHATTTEAVYMTGLLQDADGGNNDVCIDSNNQLVEDTSGTCVASSRRFKHNINSLDIDSFSVINSLQPASFVRNNDITNTLHFGFIAEEASQADKHLATYGSDGQPRGLDDHGFLAFLWDAVKKLIGISEKQNSDIEFLKGEIKRLESIIEKQTLYCKP